MKIALLLLVQATLSLCIDLDLILQWDQIDYIFPNATARNDSITAGNFVQANVFPIDVAVDYHESLNQSRIFISTPRFNTGVPITLGYVGNPAVNTSITPYPDYSWHSSQGTDCDGITSVFRTWIDECRQFWVLDTGYIDGVAVCTPQLLTFNLSDDTLINRYRFPSDQYNNLSLFITPIVHVSDAGTCKDVKVFIADVRGPAIIVYDSNTNSSWKIQNDLFYPNMTNDNFTISDTSFTLDDGLLALALSPPTTNDSERVLYFHPLASYYESSVPVSLISNASNWVNDSTASSDSFAQIGSRGQQTPMEAMDSYGNMWFVLLDPLSLVCWDSSVAYEPENFREVVHNDTTLQFASGLKVVKNLDGLEEVWIITVRFQQIMTDTVDATEINYRVQAKSVDTLLQGNTKCYGKTIGSSSSEESSA